MKQGFIDRTVIEELADGTAQNDSRFGSLIILSSIVHTGRWKLAGLAQQCIECGNFMY